ncbi:hypothetical protein EOK75_02040 [Pseudorhodobacter turbinis]|uniref:Uncharacterized protein n=1 Tax=Pseudorhodobacter turbinis TaxID=2500533 RepID=A0A4P8EE62_9RHOB|nr:hypothetical protein [Pseudorhodobacter turbinis]QCO54685.1 hypothetical protein EOK75_02040 [Pseudorhodobacter turbinis]
MLFEAIRNMPAAPQDKLQARYGPLYRWFTSGVGKDAAFAPLRDVFRQHVFATWPLAEGDSVLNYRLPERRLHSIRTASIAHDLHAKRLRRLLVDAGIIPETDRPDFDVTFDALKAQKVLEEASGAVNFASAQRRLGMTRTQMEKLIGAGLLKPGEGGDKARPRFTEATIRQWTDLINKYPEASAYHNGLSSVADTVSSLGVSTEDILRLILDGHLTEIERVKGKVGLAALLIRKDCAQSCLRGMPDKQTSKPISTVSSDLRIGRSFLLQLAQAGHFHPVEVTDGRTHQPGIRIPDEEVSLFHAQYVSRRYLSKSGANAVVVKRELDARGVVPVFSSADGKEFIYLRVDLPVA